MLCVLTEMLTRWFGTSCPRVLCIVTHVVRGLLQFTGMLKCRAELTVTLVLSLFGGASIVSVSGLVVIMVTVLVVPSVVTVACGLWTLFDEFGHRNSVLNMVPELRLAVGLLMTIL